jgi:hypothetical protein
MRRTQLVLLAAVACVAMSATVAHAFRRPDYEDITVVERSPLIVVAHIKAESIKRVDHPKKPGEGASWEHRATLVITEVLKGRPDAKEIPIVICYGLDPILGGRNRPVGEKIQPDDVIEIHDTGNSALSITPMVEDARQDHLWFLQKRSGIFGRDTGTGPWGIADPEEVQPLKWKAYYQCYLQPNPEKAIRSWADQHPDQAKRAENYLKHLEVQRILKIEDPAERCEKLLPYYYARTYWNMNNEARDGIVACGRAGGDRLLKVFDDPRHRPLRNDIILMWRDMKYRDAIPVLIDLLKEHDRFWATQDLPKGWWNKDVGSDLTRQRRSIYGEVYYAVCALQSFKDPNASDALQMTLERWKQLTRHDSTGQQIVEACEWALK